MTIKQYQPRSAAQKSVPATFAAGTLFYEENFASAYSVAKYFFFRLNCSSLTKNLTIKQKIKAKNQHTTMAKTTSSKKTAKTALQSVSDKSGQEAVKAFKQWILYHLRCTLARDAASATNHDWLTAVSCAIRDLLHHRFITTQETHVKEKARRCYYLSIEYLMGRLLRNNLANAELLDVADIKPSPGINEMFATS